MEQWRNWIAAVGFEPTKTLCGSGDIRAPEKTSIRKGEDNFRIDFLPDDLLPESVATKPCSGHPELKR
jgi:hypothetical protein